MVNRAILFAVLLSLLGACRRERHRANDQRPAPVEIVDRSTASTAGAATGLEVEPNDHRDVATPLPLGTVMRATIDLTPHGATGVASGGASSDDVDWFRIDVPSAGMLSVVVTSTSGSALTFELVDSSGAVVAKSQRRGAGTSQGVPNFAVTPGRYAAMVRSAPAKKSRARVGASDPSKPPTHSYEITAKLQPPESGSEVEANGDRDTATAMTLNSASTGYVGWLGDVDVWRLSVETLSSRNAIDVDVSAVDGVALEIDVATGLGESIVRRKAPRGAKLAIKDLMPAASPQAPPFYYLTIRGPESNPETPYQLRATAHVIAVDAEIEPNDTIETAQSFPADRTVIHAAWTTGDIDCYALPPRAADQQSIRIVISPSSDFDPEIEVVVNGARHATTNAGGRGVAEQLSVALPANSGASLLIRNADRTAAGEATYDVSIAAAE